MRIFGHGKNDEVRRSGSVDPRDAVGQVTRMVRQYVVQETLGPLRNIGRRLGLGLAGALLSGLGLILFLIGVLRLLQTETGSVFAGNYSFAPFMLTALVALCAGGIMGYGFSRVARRSRRS